MTLQGIENLDASNTSIWQVIKIVYFEDDNIELITGPIAKVVDMLSARSLPVMVLPYWKFGPHVDIVVKTTKIIFDKDIFPSAEKILSNWLSLNPSKKIIDADRYAELSVKIAANELELPPFLPLYEDNSIIKSNYVLPTSIKSQSLAKSKEDFMSATVNLAISLAKLKKNQLSDLYILLIQMIALMANKYEIDGISRGFNTFRSHAEYFFLSYDPEAMFRKNFDSLYKRYKSEIDNGVGHIINSDYESLFSGCKHGDFLRSWSKILDDSYEKSSNLVQEEMEFFTSEDVHGEIAEGIRNSTPKENHQVAKVTEIMEIMANTEEGQRIFKSKEFLTYRVVVNNFYKLLPILGFSPLQKFCLCHLLASSVESQLNITWKDLMKDDVHG